MIVQQATDYLKSTVGRAQTDPRNPYGAQCMVGALKYSEFLGAPFSAYRNAADIWDNHEYIKNYDYIPPGSNPPQPGDIAVFKRAPSNGGLGHITNGIVSVEDSYFTSVDQNWFNASLTVGSPGRYVRHSIDNTILGYLRPKQLEGGDMSTVDRYELNSLSQAYFGYPASDEFVKAWKGNETNGMIRWCEANSAHMSWVAKVDAALQNPQITVDDPKLAALLKAILPAIKEYES